MWLLRSPPFIPSSTFLCNALHHLPLPGLNAFTFLSSLACSYFILLLFLECFLQHGDTLHGIKPFLVSLNCFLEVLMFTYQVFHLCNCISQVPIMQQCLLGYEPVLQQISVPLENLCVQVLIVDSHASCHGVIEQLLALFQDADLLLNLMCQKMALCYKFVTRLRKFSKCICADVNFSTVFLVTHYQSLGSGHILG